jgi:hypothetical protein
MGFLTTKHIASPCLNCERRFVGCHSTCEDYKAFRDKLDKANEAFYEEYRAKDIYMDFVTKSKRKHLKSKGRRYK